GIWSPAHTDAPTVGVCVHPERNIVIGVVREPWMTADAKSCGYTLCTSRGSPCAKSMPSRSVSSPRSPLNPSTPSCTSELIFRSYVERPCASVKSTPSQPCGVGNVVPAGNCDSALHAGVAVTHGDTHTMKSTPAACTFLISADGSPKRLSNVSVPQQPFVS